MFDGMNEAQPPAPAPIQQDPLELAMALEWQAAQLGQQHVGDAVNKIGEAWRKTRGELAMAAARVVELSAFVAERDARIFELEAALAAARCPPTASFDEAAE